MTDDELGVCRDFRNGSVADGDVGQAGFLEFFLQDGGSHGTGTHAGIAGKDDVGDVFQIGLGRSSSCCRSRTFRFSFHVLHLLLGFLQGFAGFSTGHLNDWRGDDEGDGRSDDDAQDDREGRTFRRHGQVGDEAARSRRAGKAEVKNHVVEQGCDAAADSSQQEGRVHQDIREGNFVDTAEKVDDQSPRSGLAGHRIFREEPVSQENACAGARIGFNHVENGLACFGDLFRAEGSEDAVVDGVVQE